MVVFAILAGAAVATVLIISLWLWQDSRRGTPPGPLARRLGPFLDLLDARYAPLIFVATPQAYTVSAWLLSDGAPLWVAVMGGVGFEFVYVGAIAWAERGAGWEAARIPAITALIFSVAVAVAHYGVSSGPLAVLHIGFPLVGYAYTRMMHAPTGPRVEHVSQERDDMAQELAQVAQERDAQVCETSRAWDAAQAAEAELAQVRIEADHWRRQAADMAARPALTADHETLEVGGRRVSLRRLADALGTNKTSLGRAVARAQAEGE